MRKKVIILFPIGNEYLEEKLYKSLESLHLINEDVTFLHCIHEFNPTFLSPGHNDYYIDYDKVKTAAQKYISSGLLKIYPEIRKNWKFKCISSPFPKNAILEELNQKSNILIIAAIQSRSKIKNIFHSSMTNFIINNANGSTLVLK